MANAWVLATGFNMAGLSLFEDDFPHVPTGDYEVVITETDGWKKKGENDVSSVIFRMRITEEGPEKGKPAAKWIGITANEGNARNWKASLISCGYDAKGLEGIVKPEPAWYTGKRAYIHIDSPPKAEGQKLKAEDIDTNFISPQTYQKRKAERAMMGGAPAQQQQSTPGFQAGSPPPGLPTAPTGAAPQPPSGAPGSTLFGVPPAAPANNGVGAPPPTIGGAPPPMA